MDTYTGGTGAGDADTTTLGAGVGDSDAVMLTLGEWDRDGVALAALPQPSTASISITKLQFTSDTLRTKAVGAKEKWVHKQGERR